ncbi:MAG: hypothetical protein QOJ38_773 [Solirubrobacterales bacterium]|nr:hypothetical protein [Solirubrobacterales bacterium]
MEDGVRLGQRLIYCGDQSVETLRKHLEGLDGVDEMIHAGALELWSSAESYGLDQPVDPAEQLELFAKETERAIADGFSGIRSAADATPMVSMPGGVDAFMRWETLADRFMATQPMAGLCCYDRRRLPDRVLTAFAAVHPVAHAPRDLVPFSAFAEADSLRLMGEVDCFSAETLDRILEAARPGEGELPLDLSGLDFVDHHGMKMLVEHCNRAAEGQGGYAARSMPYVVDRMCELMGVAL